MKPKRKQLLSSTAFPLTMALKPETVHDKKWNYIYKKNSIKQCENSDQFKKKKKKRKESSYYFYHTESAFSHQQREPVIKTSEAYCTDSSPMSRLN